MTEFIQEYGKIIIAVLVVLALVAIIVLFRTPISNMFTSLFNQFFESVGESAGLPTTTFNP
ncbi:MAG: hypothetical protein LBR68_06630 [Lachnoclostridium sp.]|jgi:Flp pilus assembly pilin Flp|nr:hypothetical protein [Lachnoclostridium sp.]